MQTQSFKHFVFFLCVVPCPSYSSTWCLNGFQNPKWDDIIFATMALCIYSHKISPWIWAITLDLSTCNALPLESHMAGSHHFCPSPSVSVCKITLIIDIQLLGQYILTFTSSFRNSYYRIPVWFSIIPSLLCKHNYCTWGLILPYVYFCYHLFSCCALSGIPVTQSLPIQILGFKCYQLPENSDFHKYF